MAGGARTSVREVEEAVRAACAEERFDDAATLALRGYGADVYGFLLALHRGDDGAASEVFSETSERIWRGLSKFEWKCSLHGWLYVVARNVSLRHHERAARSARRHVPLTGPLASELAEILRTATATHGRTGTRDAIAALRDALDPDDRALLVLRLDRALSWEELARVFLDDESASDEDVKRESARLRKRYQLVKERLAKAARAAGLLGSR